jgi:hypothetical protein
MPPRRRRGAAAVDADAERGLAMRLLLHSPKDTVAGGLAFAAISAILINALWLQAGRHPSPMFRAAATAKPAESRSSAELKGADPLTNLVKTTGAAASAPSSILRPPAAIPVASRSDMLVNQGSHRVAAVQRTLTEYGYGQLKPTGAIGSDTQAAIQKFERDRKLPVTGQISDRLVHELNAMIGRPID